MKKNLIVILGPTACGKTKLAARLAFDFQGEIISVDSRQVYRGMDIGTGKDLQDYNVNGVKIPCHLIDIVNPAEEFNLFEFQKRFYEIHRKLIAKKIIPFAAGGTGLYLEAIIAGYQMPPAVSSTEFRIKLQEKSSEELRATLLELKPTQHNKTDLDDKERIIRAIEIEMARKQTATGERIQDIDAAVFGVKLDRERLRELITTRLKQRLQAGMIEEAVRLHNEGVTWERMEGFGLEYRYLSQYLQNKISHEEMFNKLNTAIHQFAKRQMTWFRRMERKGIVINWIEADDYKLLKESVNKYLDEKTGSNQSLSE